MTTTQILVGIAILCDPSPRTGWAHDIQDDLDRRDHWHRRVMDPEATSDEGRYASHMRRGVEIRIGTKLGLGYRTGGQR